MSKIFSVCVGASRLVRQVGCTSALPVMGGNMFSRESHNEPPPGSCCSEELARKSRDTPDRLTDSEWREVLSSVQYQVTRRHATERAWTGKYNEDTGKVGVYTCVCCSAELFPSKFKFDSGS